MPVRIPYLPAAQPSGNSPQLNPAAGSAISNANAQLAGQVGGALDYAYRQREQIQQVKNDGRLEDLKAQAMQDAMEYDKTLQDNNDPNSWAPGFQERHAKFNGSQELNNLPPAVREAYGNWSKGFERKQALKLSSEASVFSIQQAAVSADNSVQRSMDMEDYDGAISTINGLKITPAEKEKAIYKVQQRQAKDQTFKDVQADPRAALKLLEDPNWVKNTPGATVSLKTQLMDEAKQQIRVRSSTAFDEGLDALYTSTAPVTDEEIDRKFAGRIEPRNIARLKEARDSLNNDAIKAKRATPQYQAQLAGEVGQNLQGLIGATDFEDRYANASYLNSQMADSPLKRRYAEELQAARSGQTAIVKNASDAAFDSIDVLKKSGKLGPTEDIVQEFPVSRAVNDGFLKDQNKLLSLGFDEDQVKDIMETKAATANGNADNAKLDKFRKLWTQRKGQESADGLTRATAESILNSETQIKYQSPAAIRESAKNAVELQDRVGKLKQQINAFLISSPNATPKEIEQKVFEISGAEGRAIFQKTKLNDFPGISANTSDRITTYGYADDSTPDSNSKAGIGAWVSNSEAADIKAGKDTPNKLKAGDLAVSRDVERQFKAAGINPGDEVEITLANGKVQTSRWMDRTAESYNGKELTGRFDIYSPDGSDSVVPTGAKVTGWKRIGRKRDTETSQNTGEFAPYNVVPQ